MDKVWPVRRGRSDRPDRGVERGEQVGTEVRSVEVVYTVSAQREEVEAPWAEAARRIYSSEGNATRNVGLSRDQLERLSTSYREFVRSDVEWPIYIGAEFMPTGLEQTQKILKKYREDWELSEEWPGIVQRPVLHCMGSVEPMGHHLEMVTKKDMGFWGDTLQVMIYTRDPSNPDYVGIVEPLVIRQVGRSEATPTEFTIGNMKTEAAVRLMDSLWESGIRPSRPMPGHDMEIALLKAHIEDLRKLLWNRIGMEAQ